MCIGIPMRVISCRGLSALCESDGRQEEVDLSLVGTQPVGSWLLIFLGAAREVLDQQRAREIAQAIQALAAVAGGASGAELDRLFPDLAEREPQLPDHLR